MTYTVGSTQRLQADVERLLTQLLFNEVKLAYLLEYHKQDLAI